jgi:hypothetical protein
MKNKEHKNYYCVLEWMRSAFYEENKYIILYTALVSSPLHHLYYQRWTYDIPGSK